MKIKSRLRSLLRPERREFVGKIWLLASIFYDMIRAGVVTLLFSKHGINGWVYLGYEVVFSIFFGIVSFRFAVALVDRKSARAQWYGFLTVVTFFAPDAYIVMVGEDIPLTTYALLGLYLLASTTIASVELVNNVRKKRRIRAEKET